MYNTYVAPTIKGFRQEHGLISIKLPSGTYRVNGEIVTVSNNETVLIDEKVLDTIFKVIAGHSCTGYKNIETGEVLSVSEFEARRLVLLEKGKPDEDGVITFGVTWSSIKDRHEYELFMALWQAMHSEIFTYSKVLIEVLGEVPKKHDWIVPLRKLGADLSNTLYSYSPSAHACSVVREMLLQNGYAECQAELPSYGLPKNAVKCFYLGRGLEFSRMVTETAAGLENTYITICIPELKKYEKANITLTGTFEELEKKFTANDAEIKLTVQAHMNRFKRISDLEPTVGQILAELNRVLSTISVVEPMKRSANDLSAARLLLKEVIRKLKVACNEN